MSSEPSRAPLVSVIILSWNCRDFLPRVVESITRQVYPAVEVVIVDNASTDGTAEMLVQFEGAATVLPQPTNAGFARGMNIGFAASRGDYCVFLNCDAVLRPDFVANAVAHFERHPDVGVVGPHVWRIDREREDDWRFWERGEPYGLPFDGGVVALDHLLHVLGLDDRGVAWQRSFKANGACPVVRRATVEAMRRAFGVAPFDPVFDTYGEDVDFAFKTWALRWETMYAADVVAGHVRSYSSELHLWDKRGRLRVNLIAERYINAARYLSPPRLLLVASAALLTDVTAATRRRVGGDRQAYQDLGAALARLARMRPSLLRFRHQHAVWRRVDFAREVLLLDALGRARPLLR